MYKNILLAYDGSDLDQQALIGCKDLTNWPSAQITLLTVLPNFYTSMGMEGAFVGDDRAHDHQVQNKILNSAVQSLKEAGYNAQGVALTGDPAIEIANYAMQHIVDRVFKTTFARGLSYGPSKGLSKNDRIKETQGAYG